MYQLYPAIKPYSETFIDVSEHHILSVSQSGNPEGIPVVMLHGGPGGGRSQRLGQLFDPQRYRIILFDQRGCGKSLPYGELAHNNAYFLVDDIEIIRQHLNIDKWVAAGGSWGAQLALRYSYKHRERVSALILRSPFLGREQDIHWRFFPQGGAAQIFPDHYQHFVEVLSPEWRDSPVAGYRELFNCDNEFEQLNAARHWSIWKGGLSHFLPLTEAKSRFGYAQKALALARIESHFYCHQCFIPENYIIDNAGKIEEIPGVIIHGRYDMVCKLEGSQLLAQCWNNAQLQIIPGAGHSSSEPGVSDALIQASNNIADWLY